MGAIIRRHQAIPSPFRRSIYLPDLTSSHGKRHRATAGASFVSMMSHQGVPVEEISRLAGHSNSRTTEVIYRKELRPVITTGAEVRDQIFH